MYDEMAVVVGKDVTRGSYAELFDDIAQAHEETINLEEKGDGDSEIVKENDKKSTSSVPLQLRRRDEVAIALQRISKSKLDVNLLYQDVMRIEGLEEEFLGRAFDYLVERENLGKSFFSKE